jgi:hypothetical protein
VLKASPEEFDKSRTAEVVDSGALASTAVEGARELFAAIQSAVAADANLTNLDESARGRNRSVLAA